MDIILSKILSLLTEQRKKQSDLADFLGIHKNNITDWKSGKSKSYKKYLYQIASFLETTPEYLTGAENATKTISQNDCHLDENEKYLVKQYRSTTNEGRARIIKCVQDIVAETKKKK